MYPKITRFLLVATVAAFIVPQIALAAWWNPFSWNWNILSWFGWSAPHQAAATPQNNYQNPVPPASGNQVSMQQPGVAPMPNANGPVQPNSKSPVNGGSSNTQTCSPPGTPTCDLTGHVIVPGNMPGGQPGMQPGGQPGSAPSSQNQSSAGTLDVSVKDIPLTGAGPQGIAVDPATGYVYVGNNGSITAGCSKTQQDPNYHPPGSETMSIVDPARSKELARVNTDGAPIWPFVDDLLGKVYIANSLGSNVDVFSLNGWKKEASISVGGQPHDLGVDNATGLMVVSNTYDFSQDYYSVVNVGSNSVVAHHKASGGLPHGVVIDTIKDLAYIVSVATANITVVDMKTGATVDSFPTSSRLQNSNMLAFSPAKRELFVVGAEGAQGAVVAVNADTYHIIGTATVATPPWGMAVDDAHHLLYAAEPNEDTVAVISTDTMKLLGYVKVGSCPYAVAIDPARGLGFTSNEVGNSVSVFILRQVESAVK